MPVCLTEKLQRHVDFFFPNPGLFLVIVISFDDYFAFDHSDKQNESQKPFNTGLKHMHTSSHEC